MQLLLDAPLWRDLTIRRIRPASIGRIDLIYTHEHIRQSTRLESQMERCACAQKVEIMFQKKFLYYIINHS